MKELAGGIAAVAIAAWVSGFDVTTETFEEIDFDDILEEGLVLPDDEVLTVNNGDGSSRKSGKRTPIAIPVTDFEHAALAVVDSNRKHVVRVTPLEGDVYYLGVPRGMRLYTSDKRNKALGSFAHVLIEGNTTAGPTGSTVTEAPA
jgi:hypothetical protein